MKSTFDRMLPVISGVSLIGAWYAAHLALGEEQKFLLPPPHEVALAFRDHGPAIWRAVQNTAVGAFSGFAFAVALSFILALVLSLSPRVRTGFYPYLMVLQMTPIVVLAPILILWVGPGLKSVIIITFLICFFPMVVNTTQGLISTDRNLVDFFRMCKATKRQEILMLRVPAALPYFFTGLRIAGTLAPIGAIVGDFYAGNSSGGGGGLGFLTIVFSSQFKMSALFATAVTSCAMGFIFVGAVISTSWWALHRWHDSYSKADN
ncbi:MAG: ABC transporter permease [Undibacterium sp.]|nr:ABC transporter permease [Opitutaceae bacterium]